MIDATEEHLLALLQSASDGIYGITPEGRCTFVNQVAIDLFGYERDELVGGDMHTLVHRHPEAAQDDPSIEVRLNAILNGDAPFRDQVNRLFRKGGGSFLAEVNAEPVRVEGHVLGLVITVREHTQLDAERSALENTIRQLRVKQAELETVIEGLPQAIYLQDRAGGPLRLNSKAREMNGNHFPNGLHTLRSALAGDASVAMFESSECSLQSKAMPVRLENEIVGAVAINSDITESRLQEEALRKSEKLAALGQLASSIAHEINDPLESITNLLYLIRHAEALNKVSEYAQIAETELTRVSEITTQILSFHRPQRHPAPVSLADIAQTVMSLYTGRLLVRGVRLTWRLRPAPMMMAFAGELRQVINNFVRNAIDAMPAGGGLALRVQPSSQWNSESGERRNGVRLTIADTGEGIDPKIADRLFQPFQTTKEHTGTGLGLWVSLGIIEKQGGRIRVRTSRTPERHGTIFSIWLPSGSAS